MPCWSPTIAVKCNSLTGTLERMGRARHLRQAFACVSTLPQRIETVRHWLAEAGLKDVEVQFGYNGIEGRGTKQARINSTTVATGASRSTDVGKGDQ